MRVALRLLLALSLALGPVSAWAAGSITFTYRDSRTVRKATLAWTSDASGVVSGNVSATITGELQRVAFVPGSGGTQPTDLYDLTLLDEDGVDVLAAAGANLSNAAKSHSVVVGRLVDGTLELSITNAGNAKTGTVHIYYR